MANYLSYAKEKIHVLGMLFASLVLLGTGGTVLFPHVMEQWSHDRAIGLFHTVLGMTTGTAGLAGILYILIKQYPKKEKKWKGWLGKLGLSYLGIQLAAGILQGGFGEILYASGAMEYEAVKTVLFLLSGVIQCLVRILFLYLLLVHRYERSFQEEKTLLFRALAAGAVLSVIPWILRVLAAGVVLQSMQVVWEAFYLILFIVYFGERLREGTEHA